MKQLRQFITEKFKLSSKNIGSKYNYHPKTKEELKELVDKLIKERGNDADLNDIDTTEITDMSRLFDSLKFNGDISEWNVSNVTNMQNMFSYSDFNGDISKWNVSNVENMYSMFRECPFNGDISNWDVSNVKYMEQMFCGSQFNGDISNWDVSNVNVKYMKWMFKKCPLEKNPPKWYKD